MTREWKPGDVVAVLNGAVEQIALVTASLRVSGLFVETSAGDSIPLECIEDGTMRPLVVLDPEDREQVERLCAAMKSNGWTGIDDDAPSDMQTVLRSLVAPPKPDEPRGLGAVVEDQSGRRWVRIEPEGIAVAWTSHVRGEVPKEYSWSNIAAVRVLSEGVA